MRSSFPQGYPDWKKDCLPSHSCRKGNRKNEEFPNFKPISMARLTNQIIFICAFLTKFQPALVPLSKYCGEQDVENYFKQLLDSEPDSDFDTDSD